MQLELGKEYPEPAEEALIEENIKMLLNSIQQNNPPGRHVAREPHPKTHGLVKAYFAVEKDIPAELKHGIFKEPKVYKSYIRFSNGSPRPQQDSTGDIRGMAIKLIGVPGEKLLALEKNTQDLFLNNHNVLPAGRTADYVALFRAGFAGKPMSYFFGWNPFAWKLKSLKVITDIRGKKTPSPIAVRYWSMVPYKLGPHAVKYSAKPTGEFSVQMPEPLTRTYLRKEMQKHLSLKDATFDFMVQLQKDPVKMPVEDSEVVWDEDASPFIKVATITIPKQNFDNDEHDKLAESLSFNPWHSLPDHMPLGGINRVRKRAYDAMSKYRHERNGEPMMEPEEWQSV